jgi:hypothetical protein
LRFTVRRPPTGKTGCMQQLAGRQRSGHRDTAADRVGGMRESDMPAASPSTSNPVGLDTLWHRSRQPKSHPPHLRHPHPTKAAVQPLHVERFHSDLPKTVVHISFSPCWTAVRAVEEVLHGLYEIAQRLLLNRLASGSKPHILGVSKSRPSASASGPG